MTTVAPAARPATPGRTLVAYGLVLLGLLVWVLATVVGRGEPRSYSRHSAPPDHVTVTAGRLYSLGTADGIAAALPAYTCTARDVSGATTRLTVTAETNSKALHSIGTFVAPYSGQVHVSCTNLGDVYVDDPDGGVDVAGLLRILATVLLTLGVPLSLGALYHRYERHG